MKNKILIDKPLPGDAEIQSKMDFEKVMQGAGKTIYHTRLKVVKIITGFTVVSVAVVSAIMMFSTLPETVTPKEVPLINPPLPDHLRQAEVYHFDSSRDTVIYTAGGTAIHIAGNSLVDGYGKPVTGEAEIRYREYMNTMDIFLSGIPMTYMIDEEKYVFESAGMIDVRAFQNGQPLSIAEGKQVDIDFPSLDTAERFRLYYLDENEKNWRDEGISRLAERTLLNLNQEKAETTMNFEDELKPSLLQQSRNIKPEQVDEEAYVFDIEFEKNEFPELKIYEQVLFQIVKEEQFDPKFYSVVWHDTKLIRNDDGYQVKLQKSDTSFYFEVKPVFDKEDFPEARKAYEQEQKLLQEKIAVARRSKRAGEKANGEKSDIAEVSEVATRMFSIREFGFWNCDAPLKPGIFSDKISPQVIDSRGHKIEYTGIYVVDPKRNAVFVYFAGDDIRVNFRTATVIWLVTVDGHIGIIEPKNIEPTGIKKFAKCPVFVYNDVRVGLSKLESLLDEA